MERCRWSNGWNLSFASASWNLAGAFARATDASYFELSLVPGIRPGQFHWAE